MSNRTMTFIALQTKIQNSQFCHKKGTWSISVEAYEAEARDFGISCPWYTLPAIMQWHRDYEGHKLDAEDADLSQDPLVLCPVKLWT